MTSPKITPCLWFNFNADDAVSHYLSIFPDARILKQVRYGAGQMGAEGATMTILFELEGQTFLALNGGPQFPHTPAISLIVNCDDQKEVDHYWERLSEGGSKGRCGWLTDRFGVSWQIVPRALPEILTTDPERAGRVMKKLMTMDKLDLEALQRA